MSEFIWTDELVKEFYKYAEYRLNKSKLNEDIECTQIIFKQLHGQINQSVDKKDWQIMSFKSFNGFDYYNENGINSHLCEKDVITSVRRISDGEVFSLGDEIIGFGEQPIINIDYFDNSRISAYGKSGYGRGSVAWEKIKKSSFNEHQKGEILDLVSKYFKVEFK